MGAVASQGPLLKAGGATCWVRCLRQLRGRAYVHIACTRAEPGDPSDPQTLKDQWCQECSVE